MRSLKIFVLTCLLAGMGGAAYPVSRVRTLGDEKVSLQERNSKLEKELDQVKQANSDMKREIRNWREAAKQVIDAAAAEVSAQPLDHNPAGLADALNPCLDAERRRPLVALCDATNNRPKIKIVTTR